MNAPNTLLEAIQYFADEDVALAFVADMRWPDGEQSCPKCGSIGKHYFMKTRKRWKCRDCRHQFSIKVGTICEGSPLPLSLWLPAMWMLANCQERHQFLRVVPRPWRHPKDRMVHAPSYPARHEGP